MLDRTTALGNLDLSIARTRIFLSVVGLLSIYVDPSVGEPFSLETHMFVVLSLHLAYSVGTYLLLRRIPATRRFALGTAAVDIFFATAIALFTEGLTSPGLIFFAFAIIAVGCRAGFRSTLTVTAYGVLLYLLLIVFAAPGEWRLFVMRAIYLAITGYLLSVLGQQRLSFEASVRDQETTTQRHTIARSLHDGYVQALASVNLRLKTSRTLLQRGQSAEALGELTELERGVAREYDEVRAYVRSLVDVEETKRQDAGAAVQEAYFRIEASFDARGSIVEQALQIMLEGVRNTARHGRAETAVIRASKIDEAVHIHIDDDGIGFLESATPPWSIASRVAQFGGRLTIARDERPGAHLEIELPLADAEHDDAGSPGHR